MRRTDVITAKESDANVYSKQRNLLGMVFIMLIIIYEDVFGDQHREVIHDQALQRSPVLCSLFL